MNDKQQYKRFYVDWWRIKRSTIYSLLFLLLVVCGTGYGLWYASQNNWFVESIITEAPKDAAKITTFEGDVRIVRADTREIVRLNSVTFVSAGDTIQTQADGKAIVQMADGSILTVRPNSTVIIRDNSSIFGGTNVRVALGGGQINVKTEEQNPETKNIVEVRQSENRVLGQTEASFNINQTSNAGEIRINRGTVESVANNEKNIIKDGEYTAVNEGKLSPKEKIIIPPKLVLPNPLENFFVGEADTAEVNLRWQKTDSGMVSSYSIEIASSPFFIPETVVFRKDSLTISTQIVSQLKPSSYFWRVKAMSVSGQESEWSEPWKFTVAVRDEETSLKGSDWLAENVAGNIYLITGKTSPGSTIRILGRETFSVADGTFKLQIAATANFVVVEIKDEHGGRSKYSLNLKTSQASRIN
jgi:hypothetical protein